MASAVLDSTLYLFGGFRKGVAPTHQVFAFDPAKNDWLHVTADGRRYLTDNLYIPFAGFYPENWFVERAPWRRSLPRLLARHRARLLAGNATPVPFAVEPLADLNTAQHELDQVNTELGFLHPHHAREDLGKITHEGRYRVWKEIWMLNYLGRAAKYE